MIEAYSFSGRAMPATTFRKAKARVKSGEWEWVTVGVSIREKRKSVAEFIAAVGYDGAIIKGHWHGQQPNFSNGGEIADPRTPIEEQRRCYHARLTAQLVLS